MAQNVYDDQAFFAGYSDFPRSRLGLIGTAEWPSFRALLPAIAGKRAVELGCGFGHLARWLAGEGARSVLALDLSEKMLSEARAATEDAAVEYRRADLDTLVLEPQSTDLVVSSMTLHYVADFERIARMLHAALVPGGDLVFSVEHPVYSARAVPEWVRADDGREAFAIADYSVEGPRRTNWIVDGVVKYHRTIATMLNTFMASGFICRGIDEWRPSEPQLEAHPEWRAPELARPMFLIVAMHKPEGRTH
ncbi:MAG TPA: class I SAM-dependent methyltransferase [Devosia sp.]|nr:class I SAM-dependent methyltransferase [Devosia sp.]